MHLQRRYLRPGEIDHELLWLTVSVGLFVSLAFWFSRGLPGFGCPFHRFTGLPCPTCGATRATLQFLRGHFFTSLRFNPLAFGALIGILLFDIYAAAVLLTRQPRWRMENFSTEQKRWLRLAAIGLLLGNWAYLLTAHLV